MLKETLPVTKVMEYDFNKICRVCLNKGIMMSIFKVNVSKKMMSCSSVQVWQNDGLPTQICNKCLAKLHISFQFKKQCEKSDTKLRQYLLNSIKDKETKSQQNQQQQESVEELQQQTSLQQAPLQQQTAIQQESQIEHQLIQQTSEPSQNSCVFIECTPLINLNEQRFDGLAAISQPLSQMNYNVQPQHHLPLTGYTLPALEQLQFYNGTYSVPVQQMHATNILQNQVILPTTTQLPQPAQLQPEDQIIEQQRVGETKDKLARISGKTKPREFKATIEHDNKQCPTCKKCFSTPTKLNRHIKTHSTDLPYKCPVCNKAFSHGGNYKIHLRMHTDERPFQCTMCDKGCRQAQDLEKHMRTHTGERPHQCNICSKAFSTSSNLTAHIRTHTGEKPYVCCVCQKAFCQSNELTKHMRTHTGEKSHICDICNKGFNGSSTLIVHKRSHTGEKPYVCRICNKGFAQSSCLVVHMKRHNGDVHMKRDGKSFACIVCNKTFSTKADLKHHDVVHDDDANYICSICDKKFSKCFDLALHNENHSLQHNIDANRTDQHNCRTLLLAGH